MDILADLQLRGLIKQSSDFSSLQKKMKEAPLKFYCGIDPTSSSLHCGHLVSILIARRLQEAGHIPIMLLGGGTAKIGDPTGKTALRKMLTSEEINANIVQISSQLRRFINFDKQSAYLLNNDDWLGKLNYIDFLRDIGRHFSVNHMLSFETYKTRLQTGLSFIEFNYQLLQSYDFLRLNNDYECFLQIGGDDQWGNMVAGIDLIRRASARESAVFTTPIISNSSGQKMGKTEKGALFLDARLSSVHDFFQYWRNIDDSDVEKMLLYYTDLGIEECQELGSRQGAAINSAKEVLAYEITKLVHGKKEADKALDGAHAAFSRTGASLDNIPTLRLSLKEFEEGVYFLDLLLKTGLVSSKKEGRRLIEQGGASLADRKISDFNYEIGADLYKHQEFTVKAGKKRIMRIKLD